MTWLVPQRIALGLSVAAAAALLVVPTYRRTSPSSDGAAGSQLLTLPQALGWSATWVLVLPAVLTLLPLVAPAGRQLLTSRLTTGVLLVGVLLALASIGLFFVPALLAAVAATALLGRTHRGTAAEASLRRRSTPPR